MRVERQISTKAYVLQPPSVGRHPIGYVCERSYFTNGAGGAGQRPQHALRRRSYCP